MSVHTKLLLIVNTNNLFQILLSYAYGVVWKGNLIKRSFVVQLACNITRGYILVFSVVDSGSLYGSFSRIIKSVR